MQKIKELLAKNNIWLGIVLGLFVPLILYFILERVNALVTKWFLYSVHPMISELNIQLIAVFMNLYIFRRYLIRKEYEMTGRGVVLVTFIFILVHFYIRWIVVK